MLLVVLNASCVEIERRGPFCAEMQIFTVKVFVLPGGNEW